jgi:hypothetical protein
MRRSKPAPVVATAGVEITNGVIVPDPLNQNATTFLPK